MELSVDTVEQALVRRACAGDAEAFGDLARLHHAAALRVATVVLGATEGADDVVQLAVEKAWRSLGRFDAERPFRPWLLRIVANTARNDRRARGRRAALATRAASQAAAGVRVAVTPEDAIVDAEERRMVLEALSSLGAADRLVVALRYFEDLTEEEMAEVLGVRQGTVKSRLSRAMVRLRRNYLALVAVVVAVLVAATLVVAPAREAVARWLGLGSTRVEQVPVGDDRADPSDLPVLGAGVVPADADALASRLGRPLPPIDGSSLGTPDTAGLAPTRGVLFAWDEGSTTLWVRSTGPDDSPDVTKYLYMDDRIEVVRGVGDEAVAIDAPHVLTTGGRSYAASRVILWRAGDLEYRLESDLPMRDLVRIAKQL